MMPSPRNIGDVTDKLDTNPISNGNSEFNLSVYLLFLILLVLLCYCVYVGRNAGCKMICEMRWGGMWVGHGVVGVV